MACSGFESLYKPFFVVLLIIVSNLSSYLRSERKFLLNKTHDFFSEIGSYPLKNSAFVYITETSSFI